MSTISPTSTADRLEKLWQALQAAQQLQNDRLCFGIDHVDIYVEGVEGNWLENWAEDKRVHLRQWLQNIFETDWQRIEEILNVENQNTALLLKTAGIKRGKFIDLEIRLDGRDVALIAIIKQAEEKIGILLQLHSTNHEIYLPENLQLSLLSKDGDILQEVSARSADKVIQVELDGKHGEEFSTQITLGDVTATEDFLI
ncbi:MAG TPA: DUF1822 family protein [Leptolyngbyaceae cyanobacterium]